MPKAKITFDLKDQEDSLIFNHCIRSSEMANLLFEIRYNLFSKCNEALETIPDLNAEDAIEMVFQKLNDLYEDHDVNIDKLL